MDRNNFRVISVISIFLLSVLVATAFFSAPYVGSAYLMMMKNVGSEYSLLTSEFALPMLRAANLDACTIPATPAWAGFVWLLLFAAPCGILIWSWRQQEDDACMMRLVSGMAVYLPLAGVIVMTVVAGLAVSMACM